MTKTITAALALTLTVTLTAGAAAQTTQISPDRYRIETGVAIEIRHIGNSSYFFDWTDASGSFTTSGDATFELAAGQTFTFQRESTSHPFAICNDTLPVAGTDGSYQRTTFSSAAIAAATLAPIADFTADPAPTTDLITWALTPADIGVYYYTCTITGHPGMTGRIEVIEGTDVPCLADTNGDGEATPADFNAWIIAFNNNAPECDQNGNGTCEPADFNAWIINFNKGC